MGTTKAAVYYHFHTNSEILRATVIPEFQAMNDLLDVMETRHPHPCLPTPARREIVGLDRHRGSVHVAAAPTTITRPTTCP